MSSDSPADAKVIQLAKKIKTLAVAVEREKGRCARLEKELAQAQQERLKAEAAAASYAKLSKHRPKPPQTSAVDDGGVGEDDGSRPGGADARELMQANTKLSELRIAFDKLKIEATRMHKALVRECGEDVPIDKILSGDGNWRGRAQQISLLNDRIRDLKRELSTAGVDASQASSGSPSRIHTALSLTTKEQQANARHDGHVEDLSRLEFERRTEMENVKCTLQKKQEELAAMKLRSDGHASRVKILEGELKAMKEKLSLLLSKGNDDDALIDALKRELIAVKQQQQQQHGGSARVTSAGREKPLASSGAGAASSQLTSVLKSDLSKAVERATKAEAQVERQHKIIVALKGEIQQQQQQSAASDSQLQRVRASLAQACLETFDAVASRAHIQAERVEVERLRGLVDVLRKRCDDLESAAESSARALRNERARAVDLERRAESAGSGKRQGVKPSTPGSDKVTMLLDRLNQSTDELEQMKTAFERQASLHDNEIRGLNDRLQRVTHQFDSAAATMRQQIDSLRVLAQ